MAKKLTFPQKVLHYAAWFVLQILNRLFDVSTMSWLIGRTSLEKLGEDQLEYIKSLGKPIPPNFNTIVEADGIPSGQFRFFYEVEDRKPSDPVILFLHGGGYAWSMLFTQAQLLTQLYLRIAPEYRLSVAWLNYTVSSDSPLPTQISEAVSCFNALKRTSKNIILLGDSAGGDLAIGLLRHIHSPLPNVRPIEGPKLKPTSALLISPWLEHGVDIDKLSPNSSYIKYKYKDTLTVQTLNGMSDLALKHFKDPEINRLYQHVDVDHTIDWNAVLPPPSKVLVTYGEVEVLRDSIEAFLRSSSLRERGATIVVEPNGMHDTTATVSGTCSLVTSYVEDFLKSTLTVKTPSQVAH